MTEVVHLFTTEAGISHSAFRDENGKLRFVAEADVSAALEKNKTEQNYCDGYTKDRTLRRIAFIPDIVALHWLNTEGFWIHSPEGQKKLAEKLNDPDWAYLRTAPGKVKYSNGRFT